MRLWWVSMSLFMELEGELGVLIFSCCSSNGIPHWLMRLERSEELVVEEAADMVEVTEVVINRTMVNQSPAITMHQVKLPQVSQTTQHSGLNTTGHLVWPRRLSL